MNFNLHSNTPVEESIQGKTNVSYTKETIALSKPSATSYLPLY